MPNLKIYLAGPDVFRPDQESLFANRKFLLKEAGFTPLCPLDNEIHEGLSGRDLARAIFEANVSMIHDADIVIANCNDFRGQCIDDGTAFEIGVAAMARKIIFGYRDQLITMTDRIGVKDSNGWSVEPFGLSTNLMIENAIINSSGQLIAGTFEDVIPLISARYTSS